MLPAIPSPIVVSRKKVKPGRRCLAWKRCLSMVTKKWSWKWTTLQS
jgi:hypothetical protein